MQLLSKELVSHDYRDQLRRDLGQASICRFLIAYASNDGLNSIGYPVLAQALRDDRSFGVSSPSCACGYEALLRLQSQLPDLRLKYFMDPVVKEKDEPTGIALFHSKLIYLQLRKPAKSVVYIGSHNWTRRALGPTGSRNAEASMRFELDFDPDDLLGRGSSLASDVNRHLLEAWESKMCFPATRDNREQFEDWVTKACRNATRSPLEEATVLLAVAKAPPLITDWLGLNSRGIYLQVLDERDGNIIWQRDEPILVLVWESDGALATAKQPVMLQCRVTTRNAGPDSKREGTNQSYEAVAGFRAVIWDDDELHARHSGGKDRRPAVQLWTGRAAHVYDFELPTPHQTSAQIDGSLRPNYQFYLEVEKVILPYEMRISSRSGYVWTPQSFAVAENRNAARLEESPGYHVDPQREHAILEYMINVLSVDPDQAKVLPYSSVDRHKLGKRVSAHPLHETFLNPRVTEGMRQNEFYQLAGDAPLVADLDDLGASWAEDLRQEPKPLNRAQRVFTAPMAELLSIWREAAERDH